MPLQGEHDACGQVWNPEVDGVVPGPGGGAVLGPGGDSVRVPVGSVRLSPRLVDQSKNRVRANSWQFFSEQCFTLFSHFFLVKVTRTVELLSRH